MKMFWGDLELYTTNINMPPAQKNFVEKELIPAPKIVDIAHEIKQFANNKLQLDYKPVVIGTEMIKSIDETTTYIKDTDYTIDNISGIVTRLITGSITVNQTVLCTYKYHNLTPASTISSYGRMRRKITVEGWAHYNEWATIVQDYQTDIKKEVTLPNDEKLQMYISHIPQTRRQRGQEWITYTLELIEG